MISQKNLGRFLRYRGHESQRTHRVDKVVEARGRKGKPRQIPPRASEEEEFHSGQAGVFGQVSAARFTVRVAKGGTPIGQ
ncbi:hypothetical protein AVEN_30023-1 [Araneus ventricosus]|uniref:Uncharacterized protein n=1 Tax=Araneus ventricosus TaxID=182803 RepID=A0A4Y2DV64_ARAVE|nr:hypothetical protein AVEN_30023-1 [Araneus ventricosus]